MECPWEPHGSHCTHCSRAGIWPSLSPGGMVPRSGGKELVTQKSWCHTPDPFSSLASGSRHGVLQDPTVLLRDVPTACVVSTWRHEAGGTRHVCVFPSQDVRLFTQLHLRVLDAATNQTKYWRELSVEVVGESLPLGNNCDSRTVLSLGPLPFCTPWGGGPLYARHRGSPGGTAGFPWQDQGVPRRRLL